MSKQSILNVLPGVLLLMGTLGVRRVEAQSVCVGAFLGQGSPQEVCVNIAESVPGGASIDRRGASPLTVDEVVGEYDVDLEFAFLSGTSGAMAVASGHALVVTGTVTRMTGGNRGLAVVADGGLGPPLSIPANGLISVIGGTTGTSGVQFGGGAGYLFQNTLDLAFVSLGNVSLDIENFSAGPIGRELAELPINNHEEPIVAIRNILGLHINDVGVSVLLPAASLVGEVSTGSPAGRVLKLEVDGRIEHFPEEQFFVTSEPGCTPDAAGARDHWHIRGLMATSIEGSSIVDDDPGACGLGYVSVIRTCELSEVTEDTELPHTQCVDAEETLAVGAFQALPNSEISPLGSGVTLSIAEILTLTIADGGGADRQGQIGSCRHGASRDGRLAHERRHD